MKAKTKKVKPDELNEAAGDLKHYVIRGGIEGRERLRILSRVMHPGTTRLFDRIHHASAAS